MSEYQFYSNGKLLLSGEYLILDGARGLAIPTKYGQDLKIVKQQANLLNWTSLYQNKQPWFEAVYSLPDLNLIEIQGEQKVAETLFQILQKAREINPKFLNGTAGFEVSTHLGFNRSWGLGTSSTLINNIAHWAEIDAFDLLSKSFGGSGYDIACAQNDSPIVYQIKNAKPIVKQVNFSPKFSEKLFFVFLNKKQVSSQSIIEYKKKTPVDPSLILEVNQITDEMLKSQSIEEFNRLIYRHELLISRVLDRPTIQQSLFDDYSGQVKSLGAWGGDFVLATTEGTSIDYFRQNGFQTVIAYDDMIKKPKR